MVILMLLKIEVIYSFLNKDQQLIVHSYYIKKIEKDIAALKLIKKMANSNKVLEVHHTNKRPTELSYLKSITPNKFIFF